MKIASRDKIIELAYKSRLFYVNNNGIIFTKRGRGFQILDYWKKAKVHKSGDYKVIWFKNKPLSTHRFIYRFKNGKLDCNLQINHKDGNKTNNMPSNLELLTQSNNTKHAFRNNLIKRKQGKLPKDEIFRLLNNNVKQKDIAKQFNVDQSLISKIKHGVCYV